MAELDWGRRYLMCPPDHFGVLYEINPWMSVEVQVDRDLARTQWDALVAAVKEAGAEVELQTPHERWPDMVFTANAGIVNGKQFVPAHFKHMERQGETQFAMQHFEERGYTVDRLLKATVHEGAGDALPWGSGTDRVLISGYGMRSDVGSAAYMSRITGSAIRSFALQDPRLYHIDITFTPLDDRRAIYAPMAFDRHGNKMMQSIVPEALVLTDDEALTFCCNSIVVGKTVIMPFTPPRIGRQLEAWGFNVVTVPVTEFMKGGGGVRCLTLALDVTVGTWVPPVD